MWRAQLHVERPAGEATVPLERSNRDETSHLRTPLLWSPHAEAPVADELNERIARFFIGQLKEAVVGGERLSVVI